MSSVDAELFVGLAKAAIMTAFVIVGAVAAPAAAAAAAGATAGIGGIVVELSAAVLTSTAIRSSPRAYASIINGVISYIQSSAASDLQFAPSFASSFPLTVRKSRFIVNHAD